MISCAKFYNQIKISSMCEYNLIKDRGNKTTCVWEGLKWLHLGFGVEIDRLKIERASTTTTSIKPIESFWTWSQMTVEYYDQQISERSSRSSSFDSNSASGKEIVTVFFIPRTDGRLQQQQIPWDI